jgi:hypothetical protein
MSYLSNYFCCSTLVATSAGRAALAAKNRFKRNYFVCLLNGYRSLQSILLQLLQVHVSLLGLCSMGENYLVFAKNLMASN